MADISPNSPEFEPDDEILAEVESSSLNAGGGSVLANTRMGKMLRALIDLVKSGGLADLEDMYNNIVVGSITGSIPGDISAVGNTIQDEVSGIFPRFARRKTITFTTPGGTNYPLFTVTGAVYGVIIGYCKTTLESSGNTLKVRTALNETPSPVILTGTASNIAEGKLLYGSMAQQFGPGSGFSAFILGFGDDISLELSAAIASGVIEFIMLWSPLSSDGLVSVA